MPTDDDYHNWESQLQSEFTDFLGGIRDHFSDKEIQLRKYQVDLCQRERLLKTSEESFRERMDKFKTSEQELHERIERLNEYKKTMLKQVSAQMKTLEFRCRAGNGYRKPGTQTFEAWTQTDITGVTVNHLRGRVAPEVVHHKHADLAQPLPVEPDLLPNESEPPPPYSSNQDLTQRGGPLLSALPMSVESGYTSRGSSLSPDSARNIWDRYGQSDNNRLLSRSLDTGIPKRSYSPSRSVAVDEVQIRYGAQSPPERDVVTTSTPVKQEQPVDPAPPSSRIHRFSPVRDNRSFSPSSSGRYQTFRSRDREMSPQRNDREPSIPEGGNVNRKLPGWMKPERSTSPMRPQEPPHTGSGGGGGILRPDRSLSPGRREENPAREMSPPQAEPYGLTAQTHYTGNEVVIQYNRMEGQRSHSPSKASGIPVQRSGHHRHSQPNPWTTVRRGASPDLISRETADPPPARDVQVEVEKDDSVPEKPRLQSVRSWDIIANNSEPPTAGIEVDGLEIPAPNSTNLVPPSSGNLVPLEKQQGDEDLSKPVQDPRYFQFAPQYKSSGQPSPASDQSSQSNSRRNGAPGLRRPLGLGNKSKLRMPEHRASSASDADSRSSASNYVYHNNGAEEERGRPVNRGVKPSTEEERGRQLSRMVKSGSNIGSYDAKQYSAHHRSTSAGRVLDEGTRRDNVDEGFYDVRSANSTAHQSGNTEEDREGRTRQAERHPRPARHLPQKPSTNHTTRQHSNHVRENSGEGHYVDMNGSGNTSTQEQPDVTQVDKSEKNKAARSQSPGRFTSKLSMLIRKSDPKNNGREANETSRAKTNANGGKIKLDDKSTWAIKKRREESKKHRDIVEESPTPPPVTASTITNGHDGIQNGSEKKSKPFKRQPIPFSFGAGRRSLNSGVSSSRGRSPSPSPMRADHTIVANTDNAEGSVVRQSSGRESGQRKPKPEQPADDDYMKMTRDNATYDNNANEMKTVKNENHVPYSSNIPRSYSGNKRQITPPKEYHSRIPRSGSPSPGRSQLTNYREYNHISPGDTGMRHHNGTSTYDSEV